MGIPVCVMLQLALRKGRDVVIKDSSFIKRSFFLSRFALDTVEAPKNKEVNNRVFFILTLAFSSMLNVDRLTSEHVWDRINDRNILLRLES